MKDSDERVNECGNSDTHLCANFILTFSLFFMLSILFFIHIEYPYKKRLVILLYLHSCHSKYNKLTVR